MKKALLTTLVCIQLLITPQLHAWEMPKNLDAKQIGIVATVAAALVTLIGIACYAYKKKGVAAQVTQPENAQANESVQKIAKDVEALKKKLTDLEQLSQPLHAFHAEQLKQPSLVQPIVEDLTSHWEQIDKEMKKQAEARAKELEALKKDQAALKQEIFERFEKILQSHAQEPRVAVEEHGGLEAVPGQPEPDVHEERAKILMDYLETVNKELKERVERLEKELNEKFVQFGEKQEALGNSIRGLLHQGVGYAKEIRHLTEFRDRIQPHFAQVDGQIENLEQLLKLAVFGINEAPSGISDKSSPAEPTHRIIDSSDREELEKLRKAQDAEQAEKLNQIKEKRKKEKEEQRAKEQVAQSPTKPGKRVKLGEALEEMRRIQALRREGGDTQPVEHPTTSSALGERTAYGTRSVALPAVAPDKTEAVTGVVSAPLASTSELATVDDSPLSVLLLSADAIRQQAAARVGDPIDASSAKQPKPGQDFASLTPDDIASAGSASQSVLSGIPEETEPVLSPAFRQGIGTANARELAEMLGMTEESV